MSWLMTRAYAWPILVALVIFAILNAAASPAFTDASNWNGMLIGAAPFIITAMAQTAPVMSGDGGVDLSVGPLAGLVNALITAVLTPHGWSDPLSIIGASLLVGVASGLLNGAMVAIIRVQPIIATLGTYLAYQGITLEMLPMAGGQSPDWLVALANMKGGIPGALVLLVGLGVAWLAFERTAFRRNLLAVGGDARAAYASGINVAAVRIIAYVIGGVLAATAGIVFTAALGSGDPRVGVPYTLSSIAAVALGGVALSGGRGGMLGSAAAGALLFLIQTLFTLAQVSIFYIQIMYGVILFVALTLNAASEVMKAVAERNLALKMRIRVNGFETVCSMVEASLGVGLVPERCAQRYIAAGQVTAVPLDEEWARRNWKICVRDPASQPPPVRILVEHLTSKVSDGATRVVKLADAGTRSRGG